MRHFKSILPLTIIFSLIQCTPTPDGSANLSVREHSVLTVLYQQHAAETRALSYQAYNIARLRLDQLLADNRQPLRPYAIVTDLDETVIDNSPYNGKLVEIDEEYTRNTWFEWGKLENAEAVPGALEFFTYAAAQGVEIFYLSNRYAEQQPETMANLVALGFPGVDDAHMLLRTDTGGKEPRRAQIRETHDIIMLLGDNLADFSELYDGQRTDRRNSLTDSLQAEFGRKFIVLPNAMYGHWETHGIYEGSYDWTAEQKDSIRKAKIISY